MHVGWQFQEAQRICHPGAAFADLDGHIFLAQIEAADEFRITLRFLHRIEVLTLQILNESDLKRRRVIGIAHDHRRFRQPKHLRGAPAAFACDQLVMVRLLAHEQRLQNALRLDGVREFLERFGRKLLPRLKWGRPNPFQRHADNAFAGRSGGFGARYRLLRRGRQSENARPMLSLLN